MKAAKKEDLYKTYTADSLHFILKQLGLTISSYSDFTHPAPVDDRPPEEIAMERAANLGLKVVN